MSDEIKKVENIEVNPEDKMGKSNFFTRLMIIAVVLVFIYAYYVPLGITYVTTITWLYFAVFASVLFGINSLKIVSEMITKIKK